ncbi:Isocitrate dehydrogenase [NAD] subunit gamma [Nibea albiflora]|uniref:Isocitrate dehydrogenase [NAD] subunit gamma n=1 Tax=Nibea albiflora TaxID=240163 RepID=A0ACB7ELD3_NIBAL|nr:Isocitrate dehydrogenase [NAD] subunit gamma [Nibea albiflora]
MTARSMRSLSGALKSLFSNRLSRPPPAQYGGRHTVTLIPGDGIGPELANHVRELFRFCCVPVDFEVVNNVPGVVECLKIITKTKSLRIADYAFRTARAKGRRRGTRNTGKSIANRNTANPTAMLLASCLLLDHLKLRAYAAMIRRGVLSTVSETRLHTADLGGQGSTSEVVQSIMHAVQSTGPRTLST